MARRPLRVTGFARLMLVLLIVAPAAYIGASYYNGQDGIQNIKNFLGIGAKKEVAVEQPGAAQEKEDAKVVNQSPSTKLLEEENKRLKEELDFKSKRVDELYRETEELKRKLQSLEKTLSETKSK